ncbi:hypothetical protein D039_3199B, partial [Vibrio parahaemolyticus EKP-028]
GSLFSAFSHNIVCVAITQAAKNTLVIVPIRTVSTDKIKTATTPKAIVLAKANCPFQFARTPFVHRKIGVMANANKAKILRGNIKLLKYGAPTEMFPNPSN